MQWIVIYMLRGWILLSSCPDSDKRPSVGGLCWSVGVVQLVSSSEKCPAVAKKDTKKAACAALGICIIRNKNRRDRYPQSPSP